jgi:hypothetical protein
MYVSSYSTYINTSTSQKSDKYKYQKDEVASKSFNIPSVDITPSNILNTSSLPIDYVSTPLLLKNRYEIESQKQKMQDGENKTVETIKENLDKFQEQNFLLNLKDSYESNAIMFPILQKPHVALNQTPTIDQSLPKNIQELKENNLRHVMVNTYLENNIYYQITA